MTKIIYDKKAETYTIALPIPMIDFPYVTFKFDTGATNTIITVSSLCESIEDMAKLAYFLESCWHTGTYISKPLSSASGEEMKGILCYIKDFAFPGGTPFTFYFHLIYSTDYRKALLGADFISCCDGSFKANENIEITKFHDSIYKGKYGFASQTGSLDFLKVMQALPKISLPENFEKFKMANGRINLQEFINSLDSIDDWVDVDKFLKSYSLESGSELKDLNFFGL